MEPDRLTRAPCRDPHLLVVVALGAAGSESVPKPEPVRFSDLVRRVGEGSGALVGRDHQVGVVTVVPDHTVWRYYLPVPEVVGHIQHGPDEGLVAGEELPLVSHAIGGIGQLLADEPALGTGWHDDRVLHLLGLGKAEDLGPEILPPVGPPQPTPGDRREPEVNGLQPWRVHEQLKTRAG